VRPATVDEAHSTCRRADEGVADRRASGVRRALVWIANCDGRKLRRAALLRERGNVRTAMNRSQVSLRTVFTVCFGVVVVLVLVYAVTRTLFAITVTLLAAMIAIALDHAVRWLMRRGIRRWAAILIVGVVLLGLGALLAALIIPPAVGQATVLGNQLPQLIDKLRKSEAFGAIDRRFALTAAIDRLGQGAPALVLRAANAVVGILVAAAATVFLAVFMVIFGAGLVARILAELDADQEQKMRRIRDIFYRAVGGYIGGITVIAAANAVCTGTFLAIVRLPFFLPLAMVSGLASTVPYIGNLMVAVVITLLALLAKGSWAALACVVYFLAYGQIEGNVLGPIVFRRAVHVNPLVVTLSILFFGEMAGVVGAFVAIPLVATAQIVLRELLAARREQQDLAAARTGP
jgi:putative heme transporter